MSNRFWKIAALPVALIFVAAIMLALHSTSLHALQPDAVTITKEVDSHTCGPSGTVQPPFACMAGDIITFTIVVRTDVTETVVMTDPLPMYTDPLYYTTPGEIVFPGGGTIGSGTVSAGVYTWEGEMPAGSAVTLTLAIEISADAPVGNSLENTAYAMGASASAASDLVVWGQLFLPHALKAFTAP